MDEDDKVIDLTGEVTSPFLNSEIDSSNIQEDVIKQYADKVNNFLMKLESDPSATTIKWPDRIKDVKKLRKELDKIYKGI